MKHDRNRKGFQNSKGRESATRDSNPTSEVVMIFGRRPVQELLLHSPKRVQEIILEDRVQIDTLPHLLRKGIEAFPGSVKRLTRDKIEELDLGHHQGVLAKLAPREDASFEEILDRAKAHPGEVILILDEIADPQNLGSILRAAEAFSVAGVILTKRRSAQLTSAVVRVSAGASELLRIATVSNLQRSIELMKKAGVWVVGTALGEGSRSIVGNNLPFPLALVFGSEGDGMRELTKKLCDELVEIPLAGRMQSLNVNQATSILLFEASRQFALKK